MLTQRIDGINQRIEQGLDPVAPEWKQEHEHTRPQTIGKVEEIAAKAPAPQLSNEEVMSKLDNFMQQYYWAARRDEGKEIFKSREMPHDRDDGYSFIRGAVKEQADYEYEKHSESKDEEQSFHRGR